MGNKVINEKLNKEYKKIDVLTLLNTDPKILNRLVIAFFKTKGLYDEYRAMRSPDSGKEYKDWTKGFNNGRIFSLTTDKTGKSSDILYIVTIGFDGVKAYIRIGKPGKGTKEYNFSIVNMNFSSFMNKIWEKMKSNRNDKEETYATAEWTPIINAIKKKYNAFTIWPNVNERGVRIVFSPSEINSLTNNKALKRKIKNILNPSDYSKDPVWQMKETFDDIITAATFLKKRLESLGWYFFKYEGSSMSGGDYVVFEFRHEDDSNRRDAMTWDRSMEYLIEKQSRYGTKNDFQQKIVVALLGDEKVGRYLQSKV